MDLPSNHVVDERVVSRLRHIFAELQRIPPHRRDAECADERSQDILNLLTLLGDDCRDLKLVQVLPPQTIREADF